MKRLIMASILVPTLAWGFPWDKDMVDQQSIKPQESEVITPGSNLPVTGGETLPRPVGQDALKQAKEEAASIPNPVDATEASIARGRQFYETNCAICHGATGMGDGVIADKFSQQPVNLTEPYTQDQADGQIFFTITRGRVLMPAYRDALTHEERWDLVNFIKHALSTQ